MKEQETKIRIKTKTHRKLKLRAVREGKTLSDTIDILVSPRKLKVVSDDKDRIIKITS